MKKLKDLAFISNKHISISIFIVAIMALTGAGYSLDQENPSNTIDNKSTNPKNLPSQRTSRPLSDEPKKSPHDLVVSSSDEGTEKHESENQETEQKEKPDQSSTTIAKEELDTFFKTNKEILIPFQFERIIPQEELVVKVPLKDSLIAGDYMRIELGPFSTKESSKKIWGLKNLDAPLKLDETNSFPIEYEKEIKEEYLKWKAINWDPLKIALHKFDIENAKKLVDSYKKERSKFPFEIDNVFLLYDIKEIALAQDYISLFGHLSNEDIQYLMIIYILNKDNVALSKLIQKYGVKTSLANGTTPLSTAVLYGNDEAVDLILSKGVNLNQRDSMGNTALSYLSGIWYLTNTEIYSRNESRLKIAKTLLQKGMNQKNLSLDKKDYDPLRNAIAHENMPLANLLMEMNLGNDQTVLNPEMEYALYKKSKLRDKEKVELFKKYENLVQLIDKQPLDKILWTLSQSVKLNDKKTFDNILNSKYLPGLSHVSKDPSKKQDVCLIDDVIQQSNTYYLSKLYPSADLTGLNQSSF